MMNIIRADIYRIVRGKGVYVTLLVLLAVATLQIVAGIPINIGGNADAVDILRDEFENMDEIMKGEYKIENPNMGEINLDDLNMSDLFHSPTGYEAPRQILAGVSNLLFLLLPLVVMIGAVDFNTGAVRNALSSGISRARYFCSKLLLSFAACAALLVVNILFSVLLATVINGFDGPFDGEYLWNILKVFLPQLLLFLAGASVMNFFVFVFKKSAAVIGISIGFFMVLSSIIMVLAIISKDFKVLFNYEITSVIDSVVKIDYMSTGNILRTLAVGVGYIVITVAGGYAIFRRSEIK